VYPQGIQVSEHLKPPVKRVPELVYNPLIHSQDFSQQMYANIAHKPARSQEQSKKLLSVLKADKRAQS